MKKSQAPTDTSIAAIAPEVKLADADLDASDIAAVVAVLESGRLALGPETEAFEQAMAEYVGVRHAVAVSSGTAALHLIVRSLGLGPGDQVLVPSFTFVASANCLLFEGVEPVFVDIEEETYNLDPTDLERKVTPRTRAVMAVDVFGHPADWDALETIGDRHSLTLIDDCCEALGAEHRGRRLGRLGRAGAFAFYPNKQITTGEGGMVVTDDPDLASTIAGMRNQGRGSMGTWLAHEQLGYNYRIDEMSAALGRSQLRRIETFLARRQAVADLYADRFSGLSWVRIPVVRPEVRMSWFVYVVTLAEGIDRDAVARRLATRGIPTRAYFPPVHLQPYMCSRFGFRGGELPITERIASRTLALPFHNRLDAAGVDRVVSELEAAVDRS